MVPLGGTDMPRKPNPAFMKELRPSEELAQVIGEEPRPRTQVTKKIWEYIKEHKLQDEKQRRMINADEKLQLVFGEKNQISMFELPKILAGHLTPA